MGFHHRDTADTEKCLNAHDPKKKDRQQNRADSLQTRGF